MKIVQETVNVIENSRQVGNGFVKFASDFKAALKSGNTFVEAIQISQAALIDVVPILSQIPTVATDAVADPVDEITTAFLVGRDLVKAIMS